MRQNQMVLFRTHLLFLQCCLRLPEDWWCRLTHLHPKVVWFRQNRLHLTGVSFRRTRHLLKEALIHRIHYHRYCLRLMAESLPRCLPPKDRTAFPGFPDRGL